jgi:hypothetical protein
MDKLTANKRTNSHAEYNAVANLGTAISVSKVINRVLSSHDRLFARLYQGRREAINIRGCRHVLTNIS